MLNRRKWCNTTCQWLITLVFFLRGPFFANVLHLWDQTHPAHLPSFLRFSEPFLSLVGSWVIFQDFPELWHLGISMLEVLLIKSTTSVMRSDATLFVVCGSCGWFLRFLTPQMFNALCRLGYDPCFKNLLARLCFCLQNCKVVCYVFLFDSLAI